MSQQLPISQNQFAVVDDDDFAALSRSRWCYRPERGGAQGYAVRTVRVDGKSKKEYLHRAIMAPVPPGMEVIFLNYDRLDCRRENLKVVGKEEARQHHRVRRDSKSGVKGVRYNPEGGTWSALTYRGGRCYCIGTYHSQEAASAAYQAELRKECPELHTAPERVERPANLPPAQRNNPDAPCPEQAPRKGGRAGPVQTRARRKSDR